MSEQNQTDQNNDEEQIPSEVQALVDKAVSDPEFRQQLVDNPREALQQAGIELPQEYMDELTNISVEQRQQLVEQLGDRSSPLIFHVAWSRNIKPSFPSFQSDGPAPHVPVRW